MSQAHQFSFPLNLFAHAMWLDQGRVEYVHYGIHEHPNQPVAEAQRHSTELILQRLPPPPARLLEVGIGMGTTAGILQQRGYSYLGITPDPAQIERCQAPGRTLQCTAFEDMKADAEGFDAIVFQESAQYIKANQLLPKASALLKPGGQVIVLDELPARTLRALPSMIGLHGFSLEECLDFTQQALPSLHYLVQAISQHLQQLVAELPVSIEQAEQMLGFLRQRLAFYDRGECTYSLVRLRMAG